MNNSADAGRPTVAMSHEEHSAISRLTSTVEVLVTGLTDLKDVVKDMGANTDARIAALSERGRFTRSDVFAFIGAAVGLAGVVAALLSMRIDTAMAPIQTQNQVSIVDRAGLHEAVEHINVTITAGKEARLLSEKEVSTRLAVNDERTRELYYAAHHHYPSTP